MKITIITGASSGIGKEFAIQLDKILPEGDILYLFSRREDELKKLAGCLNHQTEIFPWDLENNMNLELFSVLLKEKNPSIRFFIPCAGFGILGQFFELPISEQISMIHLNDETVIKMTHEVIPYMKKNSRIILIASAAAFLPQPNFAIYAASKSFLLSFSSALSQELKARNIHVMALCPGPVRTDFFQRAEQYHKNLDIKKMFYAEPDEIVGKAIRDSFLNKNICIPGIAMNLFYVATKILPHGLLLNLSDKLKGKDFTS